MGTLSEVPGFEEATDLLARWAGRLPAAIPPSGAGDASGLKRALQEADAAALVTALSSPGGSPTEITSGLAWLSTLTVDRLDQADPLLAEAWAWLSLERTQRCRQRSAGRPGARLRGGRRAGERQARRGRPYPALCHGRRGPPRRPLRRTPGGSPLPLPPSRAAGGTRSGRALPRGAPRLSVQGRDEPGHPRAGDAAVGLRGGRAPGPLPMRPRPAESLLGRGDQTLAGGQDPRLRGRGRPARFPSQAGPVDIAAIQAAHRAAFYSGLFRRGELQCQSIHVGACRARACGPHSDAGGGNRRRAAALDRGEGAGAGWIAGSAPPGRIPGVVPVDRRRAAGRSRPHHRSPDGEHGPAAAAADPGAVRTAGHPAFPSRDGGADGGPEPDQSRCCSSSSRGPRPRRRRISARSCPALAAKMREDTVRLRAIADDPAMPRYTQMVALAALGELGKVDDTFIRARYEAIAAESDSGAQALEDLLEKRGDLAGASAAVDAAIKRGNHHSQLDCRLSRPRRRGCNWRWEIRTAPSRRSSRPRNQDGGRSPAGRHDRAGARSPGERPGARPVGARQLSPEQLRGFGPDRSRPVAAERLLHRGQGACRDPQRDRRAPGTGISRKPSPRLSRRRRRPRHGKPSPSSRRRGSLLTCSPAWPIALGKKRGVEIALPLLAGLHEPAQEWRDANRIATYDLIREKQGADAALAWIRAAIPDRPKGFVLTLYQMRKYDLLLGLYPKARRLRGRAWSGW